MPVRFAILTAIAVTALGPLPQPVHAQSGSGEAQLIDPQSGFAETAPELHALFDSMGLYDILGVMSAEGLASAPDIEADMFPGQGGSAWPAVVAGVYATDRLIADFEDGLPLEEMTEGVVAELTAFFASDIGQRVAEGELAARQAFLEAGVEDAARELATTRAAEGDPRMDMLTEFIAVNDLVDRNVSGALNSNFAFYRGLADGGAFEADIPEDLMLAEVWGQEGEIRSNTTEWLYGYQIMAYENLSDDDLQAYIDLSQSEAGVILNQVLFAAFGVLFERVSYDLGFAAATFIAGEET